MEDPGGAARAHVHGPEEPAQLARQEGRDHGPVEGAVPADEPPAQREYHGAARPQAAERHVRDQHVLGGRRQLPEDVVVGARLADQGGDGRVPDHASAWVTDSDPRR